jgi:hypothetical protein
MFFHSQKFWQKYNLYCIFEKISFVFKKLLSYITPINLLKINSNLSQTFEVTLVNGEMVLDSKKKLFLW